MKFGKEGQIRTNSFVQQRLLRLECRAIISEALEKYKINDEHIDLRIQTLFALDHTTNEDSEEEEGSAEEEEQATITSNEEEENGDTAMDTKELTIHTLE